MTRKGEQRDGGDRQVTVRLRLAQGSEPIRGEIERQPGTAEAFYGWLALAAVLDEARKYDEGGPR